MAVDALDPGEGGIYPYFPRNLDGSPAYARAGFRDPSLPYAERLTTQNGVTIDITSPAVVPTVDPAILPGGVAK